MPVLTLRPDSTIQLGSFTVVGAGGDADLALRDNTDTTYVQLITRCRLDTQVLKVGVDDISLPTGAKISSVRTRIRIQTVTGFATPQPRCLFWFRCRKPRNIIVAIILLIFKILFGWKCPKKTTTQFVEQELEYLPLDPEGVEWTVDSFNDFEVHLGRDDSDNNPLRISEVYVDVDYNQRPVGTAVAPTGTITDNTLPTVQWTYSDPESDRQQASQVRVFNDEQYNAVGFDPLVSPAFAESGWILGEDLSWLLNRHLPNNQYRAYVQVEQVWSGVGTHRSVTSFVSWTQAVPGPPTPLLAGAFEDDLNRVRLEVTPGGPSPVTVSFNIEASFNAGVDWELIRGGVQLAANGTSTVTLYHDEAPTNILVQYRATAFRELNGIRVGSDLSATEEVVTSAAVFWLKDPLNPVLNSPLPVAKEGNLPLSRPRSQGVFAPLVAEGVEAFKIVVTGPQYGIEGQVHLIFTVRDATDLWAAFNRLYQPGRTLLLQFPNDGEQHYVALGADLSWEWMLRGNNVRYRRASVSLVEVDKPPIT